MEKKTTLKIPEAYLPLLEDIRLLIAEMATSAFKISKNKPQTNNMQNTL